MNGLRAKAAAREEVRKIIVARSQEVIDLLLSRRSAKIAMIVEPGPNEEELTLILRAASRVPDHGKLVPWRFILFRGEARGKFGKLLRKRFAKVEPAANEDQLAFEQKRFERAPLIVAVISRVTEGIKIAKWEQKLSAGAVCQTMLIAATALGYTGCWLTEWYAYDKEISEALGLKAGERVAGFVYLGSASRANDERPRPDLKDICEDWKA